MLMSRPGIMRLGKVPPQLIKSFEQQVIDSYAEGYVNLSAITEFVEDFAIYAESHQKTGDPYEFHANGCYSTDELKDIINQNFFELKDDVMTILEFYRMFYIDKNFGPWNFNNIPIMKIW